jgi:glutamyl-tRNA reductase
MDWMNSLSAVNTIVSLRGKAAHIQQQSLDAALRRLRAGADPEKVMRELARGLTNRLIHDPSARLRKADDERREPLINAAQELFNLGATPQDKEDNQDS